MIGIPIPVLGSTRGQTEACLYNYIARTTAQSDAPLIDAFSRHGSHLSSA
nr:E14 [uncultured bacterium]